MGISRNDVGAFDFREVDLAPALSNEIDKRGQQLIHADPSLDYFREELHLQR